eukprot:1985885-Pyramimonas_sp.AAC.1
MDILFADDTTLWCRGGVLSEVEKLAQKVMWEWGEKLHMGKLERLVLGKRTYSKSTRKRSKQADAGSVPLPA